MRETLTTELKSRTPRISTGARWAIAAGVVLVIGITAAATGARGISNRARERIIKTLEETYASRLEFKSLNVSLFPSVHVTGTGLVLRQKQLTAEVPPLITVDQFSADTNLLELFHIPTKIQHVRLVGLQVHVQTGQPKNSGTATGVSKKPPNFVIGEVIADGARVETIPAKPGKVPLVWEIRKLTLHDGGTERPMSFRATLMNAQPPGEIQSEGSFGPWQRDQPAETPVSGNYVLRHADLSVFHGISGTLSSDGNYRGVLERIEVQGRADTPDFAVSIAGNPVHLTTDFHALVDGTNGTTHLQPVVARFGHSSFTAQGVVDTTPGKPGKIVSLDVRSENAHLEDLLRMAVKGKPALSGAVAFHTKVRLPIVGGDVSQELELDGTFDATSARFSNQSEQQKVDKLSNRGRGQTDDAADDSVASDFRGGFKLREGVMHFTDLSFLVPGVAITLNGDYGLADGHIDLSGTARLQAKLSQTTTGFKSFLLKAADPFFAKKGAGTVLPIKITGTRDSPSFGLNIGRKAKK
ncbi:MAG: AsmA-like C-terminal region-containing protein [Bryobacteraceae bacterium]|jgi:AsmA-like protein